MSETERLKKLEQQREALNQKIRREKAKMAEQERKTETRRKIIIGASVIGYAARHPEFQDQLEDILKKGVAEKDRHLFPELFGMPEDASETANDDGHKSSTLAGEFHQQERA